MALSKDVVIRMLGDSNSAQKAIKAAADAAEVSVTTYRRLEREQSKLAAAAEAAAQRQRAAWASVGRGMAVSGAVIAAGLALSAKAAIDWESAWAGVEKTVDGTPEQMNELEGALRNLATTLPATHEEIAGVAEAAGQLGIARGDIVEFTEVAIAMGVSTNLSAEEAATGLARLSNIMGTSSSDVDRMGSTLVALGNAGASTEGEILDMSLRIAAAGRQAGMSESDVMGFANAMSSLGIEAEAGGTAISTVFKKINGAVIDGGEDLQGFAKVAGMSAQQFAAAWRDDAAGAATAFIAGLDKVQQSGGNVNSVLGDLGLAGIRTSDTLLRLSGDVDGLETSLAGGNEAWAENSALMDEANKRYETTASKIAIARNQISDAAIDIGGVLLPALAAGADMVADFARGFSELPGPLKEAVTVLGVLAATVGLVGGAAIIAVPKVAAFRATMTALGGAEGAGGAARGLSRFSLFMTGPWGAAIGVATLALGGLVSWLGSSSRAADEAAGGQTNLASALRETKGAIDDTVRAGALADLEEAGLVKFAETWGIALEDMIDASLGVPEAMERVRAAVKAAREGITEVAGLPAADQEAAIAAAQIGIDRAMANLQRLAGVTQASTAEQTGHAAAIEASAEAAAESTGHMDDLRVATEGTGEAGEKAASAAERLVEALDALNGVNLDVRDTQRAFQEAVDAAAASVAEHGKTLDINTEAGRANQEALDRIATSAASQAEAVLNSTGSYDAFRASMEAGRATFIQNAIDMGMDEAAAKALADQVLGIPSEADIDIELPTYAQVSAQLIDVYNKVKGIPPQTWTNVGVLSADAIARLEGVGYKTRTLPDGTVEVYADTSAAENALAALTSVRRTVTVVTNFLGGIAPPRAEGGPVWPGQTFLVGERGPELVNFGQDGYVTPAAQTAQILGALRQPAPSAPALAAMGAGQASGGSTSTSYSRTFAPVFKVANTRPMTARQLMALARDEEFLHG